MNPSIIDIADVVGHFFMQNDNPNDWHYVDITHVSGDDYKWTNRAGRSWSLMFIQKKPLVHFIQGR